MTETQLAVRDVHGWYGESHVLHGMTFDVNPGEVVTLLGRNGAGKTTTMRAIMGMLSLRKGSITYEGRELIRLKSNRIARQGIAYCPEDRGIFSGLNVWENLMLPPKSGEVVLMTLVGGMGTVFGPIVGACIIVAMQNYLSGFGEWVLVTKAQYSSSPSCSSGAVSSARSLPSPIAVATFALPNGRRPSFRAKSNRPNRLLVIAIAVGSVDVQ
jgi:ABC-type sugar transport system ATPase subunit